ncbi:MAG: deoxyribodipyrimidine photolyase-related protein [Granulosicoccus sp.]|jgi:deoxyribodipyrimidine photolyase-related protein
MRIAGLIFPNQLYRDHPVVRSAPETVLLIEDSLFFGDKQYPLAFHKQKLAYHRATIHSYASLLLKDSIPSRTVSWKEPASCLSKLFKELASQGFTKLVYCELVDYELERRVQVETVSSGLLCEILPSPGFLNSDAENTQWRAGRKKWLMADFYRWQRTRTGILMDNGKPLGDKWSFDEENRKKLPIKNIPYLPLLSKQSPDCYNEQVLASIDREFADNPGQHSTKYFPITHEDADAWLSCFCNERLDNFGTYEDAIVRDENWLYHSVLTPMLNIGLLTPQQVLDKALATARERDLPLNSIEGFVRQILGWREFMRATYQDHGVTMRTGNHWQHHRELPTSFYTGTTGIEPVDNAIKRILETGYCHHIERLMVLGGFMFLCEIKPDAVYRWFMEMFIDSYDWVMVPNVYAMSQHADGGLITTKPYFSGSNYIIKMSNYKKGEWSEIWDALFWRWIFQNKDRLAGNFRWAMMCKNAERMSESKRNSHIQLAEQFLTRLHSEK